MCFSRALALVRFLVVSRVRDRPLRSALTVCAVALGTTLYVAVAMINRSTLAYFRDSAEAISGRAALTVTGDETGVPEELIETIRGVPGVKSAAPLVDAQVTWLDPTQHPRTLVVFGLDLVADTGVRKQGVPQSDQRQCYVLQLIPVNATIAERTGYGEEATRGRYDRAGLCAASLTPDKP